MYTKRRRQTKPLEADALDLVDIFFLLEYNNLKNT